MVIRVVRANLEDQTIVSSDPSGFEFFALGQPLPDTIDEHFRCLSCSLQFHLTVETYHGSGGRWVPV